jgi:hypothetical protein
LWQPARFFTTLLRVRLRFANIVIVVATRALLDKVPAAFLVLAHSSRRWDNVLMATRLLLLALVSASPGWAAARTQRQQQPFGVPRPAVVGDSITRRFGGGGGGDDWANLTIFHVNPSSYSAAPINMDTGDARGDMYFDFRSVLVPVECVPGVPHGHDCDNTEVVANDLVVTKLALEVDTAFGPYGACNICVNGSECV